MKRYFIFIVIAFVSVLSLSAECRRDSVKLTYKLHGQTRRFTAVFTHGADGGIRMDWAIERNLKMWRGSYTMTAAALASARSMSYLMPEDGRHVTLPDGETFALLSRAALEALKTDGTAEWAGTVYRLKEAKDGLVYAVDTIEGAEISVLDDADFPLVMSMAGNPLEINWTAEILQNGAF